MVHLNSKMKSKWRKGSNLRSLLLNTGERHPPVLSVPDPLSLSIPIYPMLVLLLKTVIVQWWDTEQHWQGGIIRPLCFPRESRKERHIEWRRMGIMGRGTSFHLYHYLLKHHFQAKERRTVGKQVGRPVKEMIDLLCRSSPEEELSRSVCLLFKHFRHTTAS